jgi:hypothetical protein
MSLTDDIHQELIDAYFDYFETYDILGKKWSINKYYAHQINVKKINRLAKLLNNELREEFYAIRERPGVKLKGPDNG